MSLQTCLHILHEKFCGFKLISSEVKDIESAVYEGLSAILEKGQTLETGTNSHRAESIPTGKEEYEAETYGDLFTVEKILPVGSFYEGTKIVAPNEFDFNIKLNVGEIGIHQGCRPGRVQVTFESSRQKRLEKFANLFSAMMKAALETMTLDEKAIKRGSGMLHLSSVIGGVSGPPVLNLKWNGVNSAFDISVDVMPSILCTDNFIEDLGKNEHFPSSFHQLVRDRGCYLVPKPCSPKCLKCFHVSFAQAELYLIQSLDEVHRQCYRVLKWLLDEILDTYKVKMAILDHVYNSKCHSKGCMDKCVIAVLESLLSNYNDLRMPTFFLHSCCVITKDGEGKSRYFDYLIDAAGLDVATLPVIEYDDIKSYKDYDWLDMFGWYEYQRRCLSLMIELLRHFSQKGMELHLSLRHLLTALTEFSQTNIAEVIFPGKKCVFSMTGRTTMKEWRDKVPNVSQRVFIPAFSLILEKIQAILGKTFSFPVVWSTPPIPLCLPCPFMGFSQGSTGSHQWQDGDFFIRQGAMCYIAELKGGSWYPVAFGKMSFKENFMDFFKAFIFHQMAKCEGGPRSQLVRGKRLKAAAAKESSTGEEEIPDFEGPFHHNVRYDGEAFMENIVSHWFYNHSLIRFLLCGMLFALYKQKFR